MKTVLFLLCFSVVLSGLLSSSALALTPIGPPVATLDRGQFAAGFGYGYSELDIEVHSLGISVIAEDQEVTTYFANLFFGLDAAWELQVDIGSSNYDVEGSSGSDDFAFGLGLKNTFYEADQVKWGCAVTAHWYEASISGFDLGIPWTEDDEWIEVQVAIGPSFEGEYFRLYGGPFLHFIDGEGDADWGGFLFSADFEEDSILGGFLGAQFDLNDSTTLGIEGLFTGSGYGIGGSVRFTF